MNTETVQYHNTSIYDIARIQKQILNDEREFLDSEKENNKYYIGIYKYVLLENELVFACSVTNSSFFKYPFKNIKLYLLRYGLFKIYPPINVEIMQLIIQPDLTYTVVVKTYWIRLIQRHWKRTFREHRRKICSQKYIYICQIFSKKRIQRSPSIIGLLSAYRKPTLELDNIVLENKVISRTNSGC
jgi:hypothetical protein